MGDPVPVAPSLEPVLNAVLAPREDEAPNRVVSRANPRRVIGIVSRSDLLEVHERPLHAHHRVERTIDLAATLAWVRPNER